MATNQRTVLDTSVVVSALLVPGSVPRRAFDRAFQGGKILISAATVDELNEVLRRPRFEKYVREEERLQFLGALVREAELVEVRDFVTECRDPKDNKVLELAVSGRATCIVTGDEDLLVLHPFRGIPVMTPQEYLSHSWR
jgi:uncharacterized protein